MSSLNKATLIGNLGQDPEMRYLSDGSAVCNITIATSESWKDKNTGEKKEATEWHRVTFFGRLAEIAGEYLTKGSKVYVEGKIKTKKYTDNAGIEKYSTGVVANELIMLSSSQGGTQGAAQGAAQQKPSGANPNRAQQKPQSGFDDTPNFDDDIPF